MAATFAEDFADARAVARHCAELTWRGPRPEERSENLSAWRRDLAGELAQELGQLFSGSRLLISIAEPEMITGEEVFERIGPVAVNSLLRCGSSEQTVLLSLDYATTIALTDRSFGGEGNLPEEVPAQLPRSASMLAEQFAAMTADVIALSRGADAATRGDVLVRSESVTRLKPFSAEVEVALFELTLTQGAFAECKALLAVASDRLDGLLPGMSSGRTVRAKPAQPSDGTHGPVATVPLGLEAVLSEFEISLEWLEKLAPGDEIPLTMPREVPLRVGQQLLALGALGTLDNHMALRVTRLPDQSQRFEVQDASQGAHP
ncbi:MAG: FliM/FliN family flagellar motor switch protein [Erythrobacter sp.]